MQNGKAKRRIDPRAAWGFPVVLAWLGGVALAGIVGNLAYDAIKTLVRKLKAKWVIEMDPEEWLAKLITKGEWEQLRVSRFPGTKAQAYLEVKFAERAEGHLIELQAQAAGDFEGEQPLKLRVPGGAAPEAPKLSPPRKRAQPKKRAPKKR